MGGFPAEINVSKVPNMISLGAPIGDKEFCKSRRTKAKVLMSYVGKLEDRNSAFQILSLCASSCKMVHLMRSTPPQLISTALGKFD